MLAPTWDQQHQQYVSSLRDIVPTLLVTVLHLHRCLDSCCHQSEKERTQINGESSRNNPNTQFDLTYHNKI